MNYDLTVEQKALQKRAREFAIKDIQPDKPQFLQGVDLINFYS